MVERLMHEKTITEEVKTRHREAGSDLGKIGRVTVSMTKAVLDNDPDRK